MKALALCHNVTPVVEGEGEGEGEGRGGIRYDIEDEDGMVTFQEDTQQRKISYQASSPDEVQQFNLLSPLI